MREQQLKEISDWEIKGSMSIKKDDKTLPFMSINTWQQHDSDNYRITLSGAAGIDATTITGTPDQVTLTGHKQGSAKTPEKLMQQELGYSLPMSPLYRWIRGLPSPNIVLKKDNFDPYDHLGNLNEDDWTIHYLRYTCEQGIDLPSLMTLDNTDQALHITIAISSWKLFGRPAALC